jgi:hypothetical protein
MIPHGTYSFFRLLFQQRLGRFRRNRKIIRVLGAHGLPDFGHGFWFQGRKAPAGIHPLAVASSASKRQSSAGRSPEGRSHARIRQTLQHWQKDTDLAYIRDLKEIAMLPAEEQEAWKKLWADVGELLKKVEEKAK